MWWQIVIGIVSGLLLIYAALAVLLWSSYRHNPNEPLLRETLRLVPDVIRLLRRLRLTLSCRGASASASVC